MAKLWSAVKAGHT